MNRLLVWILVMLFAVLIVMLWFFVINDKKPSNQHQPLPQTSSEQGGVEAEKEPENKNFVPEDVEFPKNFFFGTAYSDFQTTGISETSDWYDYVNKMKPPQVGPGIGNDFFNRYKEDFDLAGQLGIQVHRISLEWSRFEPKEGQWDMKIVIKYKEIFSYMKKRGVEPMICLNHFPLPKWFADQGGWENPKASYYYARYAEFIAKNLGIPLKIKWWLTFNEPQLVISIPYGKGTWPPFKQIEDFKDTAGTKRFLFVASHVMDGHRLAYRAIHKVMDSHIKTKPMVGFASSTGAFYPNDPDSPLDQLAYNIFNSVNTLLFDYMIGGTDRDFIGLNYYSRTKLKMHISVWKNMVPWLTEEKPIAIEWDPDKRAQDGRPKEFYPQALYEMIMKFKDMGLPIVITENGLDDSADKFREEFIVIHLKAIHDAIRDGANVIGYQYWALTDTWEPEAFFASFGLIAIDRQNNLKRSLRPSALTYADIIRTRTIKKNLLEKHGELIANIPPKPSEPKKYDPKVENDLCKPNKNEFGKGVVSLTFDDGWVSIYQNAIPILNRVGVKSTQYIPVEALEGKNEKYLTLHDALDMERAGHEIGSHAIRHKRFTELKNDGEIKTEMVDSKHLLLQMGIHSVDTFTYPYGEYTDYSIALSRKIGYIAVRTTDPGMNDRKSDPFLLYIYQLQNWMKFPYLKRWVNRAIADKKWLIFVFHQIEKPDYPYYTAPEDLNLLVNYLIEQKVPIMTVRDVVKKCYSSK